MGRRTCGSSDLWVVGLVGRRTCGSSDLWVFGLVGLRICGSSDLWDDPCKSAKDFGWANADGVFAAMQNSSKFLST